MGHGSLGMSHGLLRNGASTFDGGRKIPKVSLEEFISKDIEEWSSEVDKWDGEVEECGGVGWRAKEWGGECRSGVEGGEVGWRVGEWCGGWKSGGGVEQ